MSPGIFVLEMLIKIIGLGPKGYISSPMNLFDCVIVVSICGGAHVQIDAGSNSEKHVE